MILFFVLIFFHIDLLWLLYSNKNNFYPYWCYNYEKQFNKIKNNYEKIIFILDKVYIEQKKNFIKYKKKYPKFFFYADYDAMVEKTDLTLIKLTKFLNVKKSNSTNLIVKSLKTLS